MVASWRALAREHPIPVFLIVAIVWSWSIWGIALYNVGGDSPVTLAWILLGAWGPTVGALVATGIRDGRDGMKRLLRSAIHWRVGAVWYVVAIAAPAGFVAIGLALATLGTGVGRIDFTAWPLVFVALLSAIPTGALAEELGWRGFLLPTLLPRYRSTIASLIVGFVWFAWHTPLFWASTGTTVSGAEVTFTAVAAYALFVVGLSFVFTWVHDNAEGSVLIAILMHASVNAGIPFVFLPDVLLVENGVLTDIARTSTYLAVVPIGIVVLGLVIFYKGGSFAKV